MYDRNRKDKYRQRIEELIGGKSKRLRSSSKKNPGGSGNIDDAMDTSSSFHTSDIDNTSGIDDTTTTTTITNATTTHDDEIRIQR